MSRPSPSFRLVCTLFVFALAATASAQRPPATRPLAPRGTPPPLPASVDPMPADTNTPERPEVRLQFPDSPVTDILNQYQQLSGKHVIYTTKVQGQISLVVNGAVTRSEALKLIEVALTLNGFSLVPTADGDIVKVLGNNDNPRTIGEIPVFTDIAMVPDSDQIVAFLARLHYLDPLETAGVLQQFVPPSQTTAFNAVPKAGALIITDNASHLKQLVSLIAQIDLPASPVVEKFFRLERADATKAVEFLNSAFELKATPGSGAPGQPAAVNNPAFNPGLRRPIRRIGAEEPQVNDAAVLPGYGSSNSSSDFAIQGRITLTADVRTNRVHVVTSPVNIPRIEQLLSEYDADTPFAQPVRRPLRFVSAREILPILVQALSEPGSDNGNGTNGSNPATGSTNPTQRNTSNGVGSSGFSNNSNSSNGGYGSSGGGSNSSVGESQLDTEPVDTTPTEATVGNTKLIADQRNNTIILLGGAEAKDKVFEVLDQLDVRSPQVIIRTVIGELSLQDGKEFGLNYLLRSNRGSILSNFNAGQIPTTTTTTTPGTTVTDPTTGETTTTPGTTSSGSVLNSFSTLATGLAGVSSNFSGVGGIITIGRSFDIILSALNSTSRFKTISRPFIFTLNNKKAIIASGQEIAVPTSQVGTTTGTTTGSVGTYTNVDYKDVTLQLEVVPLINSEKEVTLDILQKIDSVVAGSSTVVNGTQVPTIATRYLKSTVSAPNNSTVVLGGLITQDTSRTTNDIPYLSKIPLLGDLLFKSRTYSGSRNELIILMHPEVVNTDAILKGETPKEEDRTYLGHDLETQLLPMEVRKAIPVTATPTPTPDYRRVRASSNK